MKNRHPSSSLPMETHVACFGESDLVRTSGADYELRNASADDRTAAKEWISIFMHEAVLGLGANPRNH